VETGATQGTRQCSGHEQQNGTGATQGTRQCSGHEQQNGTGATQGTRQCSGHEQTEWYRGYKAGQDNKLGKAQLGGIKTKIGDNRKGQGFC
jgi:hypothetical protein